LRWKNLHEDKPMDMEIDMAIQLIDRTASEDLEGCGVALRAGDQDAALAALGQAISNLGAALDVLRSIPRAPQDLGLGAMP
jgi:hypothetical protein